ncbi:hypothetical protein MRX96_042356 [Rhipicephalus microplus]
MRDLRQDIGPRTSVKARMVRWKRRRDRRPQFLRPSFLDFVSRPHLPVGESAGAAGCPRARAKNAAVRAGCCCQQRLTRALEGPPNPDAFFLSSETASARPHREKCGGLPLIALAAMSHGYSDSIRQLAARLICFSA